MAKERFTRQQNEELGQIKDLNGKFALLEQWLKNNEISEELYNSKVNQLINTISFGKPWQQMILMFKNTLW